MRAILGELQRMFPLDWTMRRGYRLPSGQLGERYYIQWSGAPRPAGEGWDAAGFDDDGVIRLGNYRNTVHIAQYALTQYEDAAYGDRAARDRFIAQARWLVASQRDDGGYPYPIELPAYNAPRGWISAMAQGEAASVLLRAFALTEDTRYRDAGVHALLPLGRDVSEGGASYLRDRDVFFEEVAAEPACHILNGHLYAAFALWEYVRHGIAGEHLTALHHGALRTVERWLPAYDADGWSCYDLAVDASGRRHYAPLWYHQFHIAQLRVFAAMTGSTRCAHMAEHWYMALSRRDVRARVWQYGAGSLVRAFERRLRRAPLRSFEPIQLASAEMRA